MARRPRLLVPGLYHLTVHGSDNRYLFLGREDREDFLARLSATCEPDTREITSDGHLIAAARYLARDPVEAGLVTDPVDWPWSSARAHAGLERPHILLAEGDLRAAFGDRDDWRRKYRAQIRTADEEAMPRAA